MKLRSSQFVVIDNVANYYFQELSKKLNEDVSDLKVTDFTNVMLPFETTFLEMRLPDTLLSWLTNNFKEVGLLARMHKPEATNFAQTNDLIRSVLFHEDAAYHLVCLLFVFCKSIGETDYIANFTVPVNNMEQVISPYNDIFPFIGALHIGLENEGGKQETSQTLLDKAYLFPCLFALSFMYCRTVKTVRKRLRLNSPRNNKKEQAGRYFIIGFSKSTILRGCLNAKVRQVLRA